MTRGSNLWQKMSLPWTRILACTSTLFVIPALITIPSWSFITILNMTMSLSICTVSTIFWLFYSNASCILHRVDILLARSMFVVLYGCVIYTHMHLTIYNIVTSIMIPVSYSISCMLINNNYFILPHAIMHICCISNWIRLTAHINDIYGMYPIKNH